MGSFMMFGRLGALPQTPGYLETENVWGLKSVSDVGHTWICAPCE